jgi:prepilin-type N-terminal cleavage/methylation domain-containing protein
MNFSHPEHRRGAQRGYSLAEILVVMAVFTIIIIAALLVYDKSNKVFKQSVESSDMQQSTRVAFDKLVADIRLAGFDYDRDGIPFGSLSANWTKLTSYTQGNLVQPVPANGHVYVCTTGGTSGNAAPAWTTGKNDVINDSGVVWQETGNVQYQQPDEQIEYAGRQAITIRGNFNYETALGTCPAAGQCKECENGREQCLETNQFPLVTTSNQEIVTYALVSNSGNANANKDTITFFVDTDIPRDVNPGTGKQEKAVNITGVDLTNNYPPYTLYRYTLKDDGTPDTPVPIADNIRGLNLRYFTDTAASAIPDATGKTHEIGCGDATKCEVANLPFGAGQYNGASPDTVIPERDTRAKIKSIRMTLVGMNPQPDIAYSDTDTVAPHYRKLQLDTIIVPRNLGKHGMKEFSTTAPGTPTLKSICVGACAGTYATWSAPTSGGDIDSYSLVYSPGDCNNPPFTYAIAEDEGKNLSGYASKVTPGTQYRFAVQAINKYGSVPSNCIAATPLNKVKPAQIPPNGLDASGGASNVYAGVANAVQLYWPPTTTNQSGLDQLACVGGGNVSVSTIPWAEKIFYRVKRGLTAGFDPTLPGTPTIVDENSATQPTAAGGNLTINDTTAANCIPYYYKIETVNYCVKDPTYNQGNSTALAESGYTPAIAANGVMGQAITNQTPAAPTGLNQSAQNPSTQPCPAICDTTFRWLAVNTDTGGAPLNIGRYNLYVTDELGNPHNDGTNTSPFTSGTTSYQVKNMDASHTYTIQATAVVCGKESAKSAAIQWPCVFSGGTLSVAPEASYGGDGLTKDTPWIINGQTNLVLTSTLTDQSVDYTVTNNVTGQLVYSGTVSGPSASFNIPIPDLNGSNIPMRVRMTVYQAGGTCSKQISRYVMDEPSPPCSLLDEQTAVNQSPVSHVATFSGSDVTVTLKNNSSDLLKIKKVIVKWDTNYANGNATETLSNVIYPTASGTATLATACSKPTLIADISSNAKDLAANSSYNFTLDFNKNGVSAAMLFSVCIEYQTPFGDIKTCQIFPNANPCVDPGGAQCQ